MSIRIVGNDSKSIDIAEVVNEICRLEDLLKAKGFETAANVLHKVINLITGQHLAVQNQQRLATKRINA